MSYLEAPTPTALMREKLPGLSKFRPSGDPYAKEARMVAGDFGLEVFDPSASLAFSSNGEGTIELFFEPRALGSFDEGFILAMDDRRPQPQPTVNTLNQLWVKLVTDPEDPSRARIEVGYWAWTQRCDGPFVCLLAPAPHIVRTVDPVLADAGRHHLALVFEDEGVGVVLDGVERKVALVEGEERLRPPRSFQRIRVGGALVAADDLRIWRRPRSSAEIEAEAAYLPPGYHRDADLVARWESDWDSTAARDGSNRIIWRNSRILTSGSLDGYYLNGAEPVGYDAPSIFELSIFTSDGGSGFYQRGGFILDDEVGNRMWAMRSAAGLREGPNGTEASLELYLQPIRYPFAMGNFTLTGDGPNGITADYDDGIYVGADALGAFIEGNARLQFEPAQGPPVTVTDWRMTYGCPDDEPGCDELDKELQFGGPLAVGLGLPDGMVLEIEGGGRIEGDNLVANGDVVLKKIGGGDLRLEVASAEVTVGASKVAIAGSLSLGTLGGRLADIFGDTSVEASLELDLDARRVCADFSSEVGFSCQVHFCIGFQQWGQVELELGCGGLCSSDSYCGDDASCQAGLCVGLLPDGAPCYADNICLSGQCGSILRELECRNQASGLRVSCLGVCYSNNTADLGDLCWDDAQCARGACEPIVPLGGLEVVNRCMCSPSDCSSDEYCSDLTGRCHPKKPSGNSLIANSCLDSSECVSGRCHLGFCSCSTCPAGDFCATLDNTLLPSNTCEDKRAAGKTCVRDAACASDNCVAGFCGECKGTQGCASDSFCTAIGKCIKKLGPGLLCTADNQCGSNKCRSLGGSQIKQCVECEQSAECGSGKFCEPVLRRCEPKRNGPAPCLNNEQCKSNRCNAGLCGCSNDSQCSGAFWCRDNRDCFPDLPLASPCDRNAQCLGNRCNLDGSPSRCVACTADSQCPGGWCGTVGGLAACLPDLLPLAPCSKNEQCISGLCESVDIEIIPNVPVTVRLCR